MVNSQQKTNGKNLWVSFFLWIKGGEYRLHALIIDWFFVYQMKLDRKREREKENIDSSEQVSDDVDLCRIIVRMFIVTCAVSSCPVA
jgi:hypothetical protein